MKRLYLLGFALVMSLGVYCQSLDIHVKVLLQGAYAGGGTMTTHLNIGNHLPLQQPYNTGIWAYPGTEALISIPAQMVDWVLLDLRSAPDTAVARKACLLYSDGSVRDVNGNSQIQFNVPPGNYYVAVLHKSHLSAMSAARLALPASGMLDFSDTAAFPVFGRCVIQLAGGVEALIAGDITDDKMLKYSGSNNDRSPILQRILGVVGGTAINALIQGYYREDLRMDGNVKYSGSNNDPSMIIQNLVTLTGSNAINATFAGPVPHAVYAPLPCYPQPDLANAGPDSLNIQGISIQLRANTPVSGSGQWTVVSGLGGSFADDTLATTQFTGQAGSTYTLVWTISTVCGSRSDTVLIQFNISQTFTQCGDLLTDMRDGQQYPTVQISTQCWMAKNLNMGVMVSDHVTGTLHTHCSDNGIIEKYCYINDPANCATYGGFYAWNEMMNYTTTPSTQGICPSGWHIPTDAEWCTLTTYLDATVNCNTLGWSGTNAGGKMKETGTTHWVSPNIGATNSSGFTALGAGYRDFNGDFSNLMGDAYFWSSSEHSAAAGFYRNLNSDGADVYQYYDNKAYGFSVRCIKDNIPPCTPQPDQANAGPDSLNIQGTSIQLQANVPVNGSGQWTVVSGLGGSFADDTLATTLFTGQAGSTFTLVWTISTVCGSSSDSVQIGFATPQLFTCGSDFTDQRDGQVYPTVQIGNQCWMAKNLNTGSMVTDHNTGAMHSHASDNGIIEKYCYNNDTLNCTEYGGLYDWNEAMGYVTTEGVRGICPEGWHIPTDTEWMELTTYLGGEAEAGGKLKETGYVHWSQPNTGATNVVGFSAIGNGWRNFDGGFYNQNVDGYYWTSTEYSQNVAWYRQFKYSSTQLVRDKLGYKTDGTSVRCLMDNFIPCTPQPDQANAGSDSLNIQGISIQLQANTPVNGSGQWTVVSGQGGSFADDTLATTLFTGQVGSTYTLGWTISTVCGSSSDTVLIQFLQLSQTFVQCGDTLTDTRDGQQYPTVQIGTQCWMAKNLNIGARVNGSNDQVNNGIAEKYCYNDDAANCLVYGGLYQWDEMMNYSTTPGIQGICPTGWHIPTDAEWCAMTTYLDPYVDCYTYGWSGIDAGGKMKAMGFDHWLSPNTGANNSSGFSALGAGCHDIVNGFWDLNYGTYFWSSSEYSAASGLYRTLGFNGATVTRAYGDMTVGYSVRCLSDSLLPCSPQPDQANAGPDSLNVLGTSIQLQANVPVNGSGQWTVVSGLGGSFADDTLATTLFTGQAGSTFTLVWTISTVCGSSSDSVQIGFATPQLFTCGSDFTDQRDGQVYPTVQIGARCWMARDLNVGTFVISTETGSDHSDMSDNSIIEKYCFNNDTANCGIYGGLYDWDEAMDYVDQEGASGICPEGWRIPTDAEWSNLAGSLDAFFSVNDVIWGNYGWRGSDAGGRLKEAGTAHWIHPNYGATNVSGFTALPSGTRGTQGNFYALTNYSNYWTSSSSGGSNAWIHGLRYNESSVDRYNYLQTLGCSVRCLRSDFAPCQPGPSQAYAGTDTFDLPGTTYQLQGNQPLNATGLWTILWGQGGSFSDPTQADAIFTGMVGQFYTLVWTHYNGCGTTKDIVLISFALVQTFNQCGDVLVDMRDAMSYPTVLIGNQCWMAQNLNAGDIAYNTWTGSSHSDVSNNGNIEKYCIDNQAWNCQVFGGLYDWNELMNYGGAAGSQGICPSGWHVPSDAEWKILEGTVDSIYGVGNAEWDNDGYRGYNAGGALKGFNEWWWPNTGATNSSGFTAMPGGMRYEQGYFYGKGESGIYWTSNEDTAGFAIGRSMHNNGQNIGRLRLEQVKGASVRCIKDCSPLPDQANAGPDLLNIQGTSCALQASMPIHGSGSWSVISGVGGSVASPGLHNSVFNGTAGSSYTLVWTVSNACGSSSDTVQVSFSAATTFTCGSTITDTRDGQLYPTVLIGTQCWMARNLNVGTQTMASVPPTDNGIIEKHCYDNNSANCDGFGGLYTWAEAMAYQISQNVQGICPSGWVIPSDSAWTVLEGYLGGPVVAGGPLKETGFDHWSSPNTGATNSTGFTGVGGGYSLPGSFGHLKARAYLWTSSSSSSTHTWMRSLYYYLGGTGRNLGAIQSGFSVRCLKEGT